MNNNDEKKPIYICFEGVDGSGKSTVFNTVLNLLKENGYDVVTVCPTQKKCDCKDKCSKKWFCVEGIFKTYSCLNKNRWIKQLLYAYRSNKSMENVNYSSDIWLGDRGLITTYISRWELRKISRYLLELVVNLLENKIVAPDYVFYIDVDHKEVQRRLDIRGGRDIDETAERSLLMRNEYQYIKDHSCAIKRIKNVKWYVINGAQSRKAVIADVRKGFAEIGIKI